MKYLSIFILLLPIINYAQGFIIKGVVKDAISMKPLGFVQIGIPSKKIGTLSDDEGQFVLVSEQLTKSDTITFSYLGYQTEQVVLKATNSNSQIEILLKKSIKNLPTVIKLGQKLGPIQKIGFPKTKGKRKITGWYNYPKDANFYEIGERGTIISLKEEVLVKSVNFHLARTNFDSLLFRVHIYDFRNGVIKEELTKENIFILTSKKRGWVNFAMDDYTIVLKNDFLISLEWVQGWTNSDENFVHVSCGNNGIEAARNYFQKEEWHFSDNRHVGIFLEVKSVQ